MVTGWIDRSSAGAAVVVEMIAARGERHRSPSARHQRDETLGPRDATPSRGGQMRVLALCEWDGQAEPGERLGPGAPGLRDMGLLWLREYLASRVLLAGVATRPTLPAPAKSRTLGTQQGVTMLMTSDGSRPVDPLGGDISSSLTRETGLGLMARRPLSSSRPA